MTTTTMPPRPPAARRHVPTLESGDRLTRDEFEQRYDAMPGLTKAELIEGVVFVAAAVRAEQHGTPHAHLLTWLGTYSAATPGVAVADNTSIRLDLDNEPQPDGLLWIESPTLGQARVDEAGYLVGPPELVAEVAASSASIDLHTKLNAYRRNGVREYLVWRVLDQAIDWFTLCSGVYETMTPDAGLLRSTVYPGLWLDRDALLRSDMKTVLARLQQGVASPEHAAWAARLTIGD